MGLKPQHHRAPRHPLPAVTTVSLLKLSTLTVMVGGTQKVPYIN